jgi:hypothetical protein
LDEHAQIRRRKEYYVRFWTDGIKDVRLKSVLSFNDVLKCYEGYVKGQNPDDVFDQLNDCYIDIYVQRCGEVIN